MKKIIKEIRLKKDTPDHRAGDLFVLMSNNGIYEIGAGEDDPAVFYGGDVDNFDEWFEMIDDKQGITDALLDVTTNRVHVGFVDDLESIEFLNFMRAVSIVSKDTGFMTRGPDRVGWSICLKDDGQLDITVTSNELAGGFCFEWSSDAEASIKNHPDEWKTIAKYKWGK